MSRDRFLFLPQASRCWQPHEAGAKRSAHAYNQNVRRDRALWLIITYKLVKGVLWLVFAAVIAGATRVGLEDRLLGFASQLRHHSRAWSLDLAQLIVHAASRRGLWTIIVALVADGAVSLLEGWALLHGRWWGPWLVVIATGSFLPLEVVALARHVNATRAVLLVGNLAIVLYLAHKAVHDRRVREAQSQALEIRR
jgi:uncharacterized membrane protein (DUF2068 family)